MEREATFRQKIRMRNLLFMLFLIISIAVIIPSYLHTAHEEHLQYLSDIEDEGTRTFLYFSSDFENTVASGTTIFSARWYQHLQNNARIYEDDFIPLERMELLARLRRQILPMTFVREIIVATSEDIITLQSWYDYATYNRARKDAPIVVDENGVSISCKNNDICLYILRNNTKPKRGLVAFFFDKVKFSSLMDRIRPPAATFCSVYLDDQPLYQYGEMTETDIITRQHITSPNLRMEIAYPNYLSVTLKQHLGRLTLYLMADIFGCFLLALLLSRIMHKPLSALVRQIGGDVRGNPYSQLDIFIENSSRQNAALHSELKELNASMEKVVQYSRKRALMNMLTSPDFDFQAEFVSFYIPWINENNPFFFILMENVTEADLLPVQKELEQAAHYFFFPVWQKQSCLLLWFTKADEAKSMLDQLSARLETVLNPPALFICSDVLFEAESIYNNFMVIFGELEQKQRQNVPSAVPAADLPLTIQLKLVQNAYNGHVSKFLKLCQENWEQYPSRTFYSLLSRLIREMTEKPLDPAFPSEGSWENFEVLVRDLLQEIDNAEEKSSTASGYLICDYIRQHFQEEDMCMKKLSEVFSLHRNLLSKMIRTSTGMGFTDFLLELRLRKAIGLLTQTDLAISSIAEQIGYTSYLTFKRAFQRGFGITPKEYRELAAEQKELPQLLISGSEEK